MSVGSKEFVTPKPIIDFNIENGKFHEKSIAFEDKFWTCSAKKKYAAFITQKTIAVWDLTTCSQSWIWPGKEGGFNYSDIYGIVVTPKGKVVVYEKDKYTFFDKEQKLDVKTIDGFTGDLKIYGEDTIVAYHESVRCFKGDDPKNLYFSCPSGNAYFVGKNYIQWSINESSDNNSNVIIWDKAQQKEISFPVDGQFFKTVIVSHEIYLLFKQRILIRNLSTQEVKQIDCELSLERGSKILANKKFIVICNRRDISVLNLEEIKSKPETFSYKTDLVCLLYKHYLACNFTNVDHSKLVIVDLITKKQVLEKKFDHYINLETFSKGILSFIPFQGNWINSVLKKAIIWDFNQ